MKILLIGEYSGFHNSLKKGLQQLGHTVVLIGDGDNYKNYPVDVSTRPVIFSKYYLPRKFKNAFYTLFKIDLLKVEQGLRYLLLKQKFRGYDVVQLINSDALFTYPWLAKPVLKSIFKHNNKVVLSACGDDTHFVDWLLNNDKPYNLLTPLKENKVDEQAFKYTLKYTLGSYRSQYSYVTTNVFAIIPTDMDYLLSLKENAKTSKLIPTPIDLDSLDISSELPKTPIHIFHGISNSNYIKKGNSYFEDALKIIEKKYTHKVKITSTRSLPYKDYIKANSSAHILLDQIYSYDQGYNALEAMAKGKVVFTGAESCFYEHYNLQEDVCINAKPDVAYLVEKLSKLIENPKKIASIGYNAKLFVSKYHNLETVSKQYIEVYNSVKE